VPRGSGPEIGKGGQVSASVQSNAVSAAPRRTVGAGAAHESSWPESFTHARTLL